MKKLITVLFLVTALITLTVTASAAEKYLTLPKTEYGQNEDILITASGEGKDWVGIYAKGETPGGPASIYWYYVAEDAEPGEAVDIREQRSNNRAEYDMLPPGEYTVWLLLNDGYDPFDSVDITILATLELDKYAYTEGDDILVTANGEGKDWVGLYPAGEIPGGGTQSIYWYYVADGHTPMEQVNIKSGTHNTDRSDYADLPAGDYTMFLLANDGYDVIDSIDFTIREGKKAEPAPAAEEPAPAPEEPAPEAPAAEPAEENAADNAQDAPAASTDTAATGTEKSGCGSFLACGPVVLLSVLGCGLMARRKER